MKKHLKTKIVLFFLSTLAQFIFPLSFSVLIMKTLGLRGLSELKSKMTLDFYFYSKKLEFHTEWVNGRRIKDDFKYLNKLHMAAV